MKCPYCLETKTKVVDKRDIPELNATRRRRECLQCGKRFTTYERIESVKLSVIKKDDRRESFDRDKLMRSLQVALRKRQVDPDRVERMVNGIVRQLESTGDTEIPADQIGLLVMEGLKRLDDVAYVRFASVYRNFREAKDFETLLGELSGDDASAATNEPASDDSR